MVFAKKRLQTSGIYKKVEESHHGYIVKQKSTPYICLKCNAVQCNPSRCLIAIYCKVLHGFFAYNYIISKNRQLILYSNYIPIYMDICSIILRSFILNIYAWNDQLSNNLSFGQKNKRFAYINSEINASVLWNKRKFLTS